MKLRADQLPATLKHTFARVYLVSGDEPLLAIESCDCIRHAAKEHGFTERLNFHVNAQFDWQSLEAAVQARSLFFDKTLLELSLETTKLGKDGSSMISQLCETLPDDKAMLIRCEKLDTATQKTKWVTAIDKRGVIIPVWPIALAQMPEWIKQRLSTHQLHTSASGLRLIADKVEGNLLAAKQTIEKCALTFGSGELSIEQIQQAITDHSRYDVFQLMDCALEGNGTRAVKILNQLQAQGVESILVLWALHRDVQLCNAIAFAQSQQQPIEPVFAEHRVWDARKALLTRAVTRHKLIAWQHLLSACHQIDEAIKGARSLDVWQALLQITLRVAGVKITNTLLG